MSQQAPHHIHPPAARQNFKNSSPSNTPAPTGAPRSAQGSRPSKTPGSSDGSGSADPIIATFNTWAYKREQPSSLPLMRTVVEQAIETQAPIPFVLYWGKGPREARAAPDDICLDYLAGMGQRIAGVHRPGARFHIILTDTHARLNHHPEASIATYYAAIGAAAAERGFVSRTLSDVVGAARPIGQASNDDADAATPEMVRLLTESAAKWYRGDGAARDGAAKYYAMNMIEKQAVELAYPEAIFASFNDSRFRALFPAGLPIFYMYSVRKGVAVKPWFMDAS